MVVSVRESEVRKRRELERLGLVATEKLAVSKGRRTKEQEEYECESCRANLYLSLVNLLYFIISYIVCINEKSVCEKRWLILWLRRIQLI
jgi:hypothetical protein